MTGIRMPAWLWRRHQLLTCRIGDALPASVRYRMKPMERFLTVDETARLNAVLTRREFRRPDIVAIVRLLVLTGCRFGEDASLKWDWTRDRRIHLPQSKSGPRPVPLGAAARARIEHPLT